MKPVRQAVMAVFFALAPLGLQAPDAAAQRVDQPKPPVVLEGYGYEYLPRGQVHKFYCEVPECVPGSKVSYTLYAPEKNPDFEKFKSDAKYILDYMESRLPPGATITLGQQEKTEERLFTTFTSTRTMQLANGVEQVTVSTLVYTTNFTISVISSAENRETAETNKAGFLVGLLTWSETLNQQGPR